MRYQPLFCFYFTTFFFLKNFNIKKHKSAEREEGINELLPSNQPLLYYSIHLQKTQSDLQQKIIKLVELPFKKKPSFWPFRKRKKRQTKRFFTQFLTRFFSSFFFFAEKASNFFFLFVANFFLSRKGRLLCDCDEKGANFIQFAPRYKDYIHPLWPGTAGAIISLVSAQTPQNILYLYKHSRTLLSVYFFLFFWGGSVWGAHRATPPWIRLTFNRWF